MAQLNSEAYTLLHWRIMQYQNRGDAILPDLRIRQLVIAANDIETAHTLQRILGLGPAFPDPGVAAFGLINAVYSIGDQFLEVVVPTTDTAPARRFIDRSGEGGYMAIFQIEDIDATRQRVDQLGMRRVWDADFPEISASHIHPADIGGAIVSFDQPRPASSWKWGGPKWTETAAPGALVGATLSAQAPDTLAKKWADALGGKLSDATTLETLDGKVKFIAGPVDKLIVFSVKAEDREAVLARAEAEGCDISDDGFWLVGVHFLLTE